MPSVGANFAVKLITSEGKSVEDPAIRIRFRRTRDGKIVLSRSDLDFSTEQRFVLKFPPTEKLQFEIEPSLFRNYRTRPFFPKSRGQINIRDQVVRDGKIVLLRSPGKWNAGFRHWADLKGPFLPLAKVLTRSKNISIKGAGVCQDFTGNTYDQVSSTVEVHAKATLLNLFARMTDLKVPHAPSANWFDFVERILVLGRERFVAIVDTKMYEGVKRIHSGEARGYKSASASLHLDNFPARLALDRDSLISIKSVHDKANLQLTVGTAKDGVAVLDADIDENGRLLEHFGDLIRHRFTGGTHPHDIHEYLLLQNPKLDLGYWLTPVKA